MPILKDIAYKPPGAVEWQRIVVVVDDARNRTWSMRAEPMEPPSPPTIAGGLPGLLAALFGVPVRLEPPPVPSPRKSPLLGSIDRMIEGFARQGAEARRQSGSRPATPSAGSGAEKLGGARPCPSPRPGILLAGSRAERLAGLSRLLRKG